MTPDIIDAEVIELPRPDHWIGVSVNHGTVHLWSNTPRKTREELVADSAPWPNPPQFFVRLPGSSAPAPEPATDASEIDRIIFDLGIAQDLAADGQKAQVRVFIHNAIERLSKIRGGR